MKGVSVFLPAASAKAHGLDAGTDSRARLARTPAGNLGRLSNNRISASFRK